MIIHVNKENFEEILKNNDTVLVDFFATWCGPCQMLGPVLEKISEENENIVIAKVDIDELTELAIEYDIQFVPTLVLMKNGKEVNRVTGLISKQELLDFIK